MEIQEQKATVALPTLLIDQQGSQPTPGHPGIEQWGYLAVEGELEYALRVGCQDGDPTQVTVNVRLLAAHYSPPAGLSQQALATVNQVNAVLAQNLTGQ